tara:strand:+ start:139 stop:615 length:477 start_codon:yes stop_codon:yes gene_type:complete
LPEKFTVAVRRSATSDPAIAIPERASKGAAGFDLRANISSSDMDIADVIIPPGKVKLIPTGLVLEIPAGFEGQVRPRSGLALRRGVTVLNSPGTIDSDYRGEVGVILINLGESDFHVAHGDRIAQIIFQAVPDFRLVEVEDLSRSSRDKKGFGSSGVV